MSIEAARDLAFEIAIDYEQDWVLACCPLATQANREGWSSFTADWDTETHFCEEHHIVGGGPIDKMPGGVPSITARVRIALAEAGYTKREYVTGDRNRATVHPIQDGRMEIPGWTIWLATTTAQGIGAPVGCYTCWANQRICPNPRPYVPGRSLLDDCEPPLGQGTSIDHLRWDGCLDD